VATGTSTGSPSVVVSFDDTTAPAVFVDSPADSDHTPAAPTISGRAGYDAGDDPKVTLELSAGFQPGPSPIVYSADVDDTTGRWSRALPQLGSGWWTIVAKQGDGAGNSTTTQKTTFFVDPPPPANPPTTEPGGNDPGGNQPGGSGPGGNQPGGGGMPGGQDPQNPPTQQPQDPGSQQPQDPGSQQPEDPGSQKPQDQTPQDQTPQDQTPQDQTPRDQRQDTPADPPASQQPSTPPARTVMPQTPAQQHALKLTLRRQHIARVLRHGLVVGLRCGGKCNATRIDVVLPARYAKRYGLGKKSVVIGHVTTSKTRSVVHFTAAARRALRKAHTLRVTVRAKGATAASATLIR
jgi:hypothetical protein